MMRFKSLVGRPLRATLGQLGYEIVPRRHNLPPDIDDATAAVIRAVQPFGMTSPERLSSLCEAVRYLQRRGVDGAMVECGVWRGGSMMAVAMTLLAEGSARRDLYLFDTFEGMAPPSERDVDLTGIPAAVRFPDAASGEMGMGPSLNASSLDEVKANLASTGYPIERSFFVKGLVEETVPDQAPARIALLRLDTDWYRSTLHELTHLFGRISPGGVLIVDDYGHWQGAKDAVDEFLDGAGIHLLLHRIDYTGRIAVVA
jgi:hypothetical protein